MDPYIEILNHMRNEGAKYNPPGIQLGEMINSNTLKIGDLQVTKDNLLVADYLLTNYKRIIDISETTATGNTDSQTIGDYGSHSHNIERIGITDSEITYKDTLKKGDIVAVIPTKDGQIYIILARVVNL